MKSRNCGLCGSEWVPKSPGESRRSDNCCDACYPLYRKAYSLYHNALYRANERDLPFDLDIEYVHEQLKKPCPRTGMEFVINSTGRNYKDRHPATPSVDRISSIEGYTKENCQIVCWWYNLSKALFTDEEVLELCQKVVNLSNTQNAPNADHLTP